MQVFRDLKQLPATAEGAALVLGNFDGVHQGHAALLKVARNYSDRVGVVTFSPHPRLLKEPGLAPFLLTPGESKMNALAAAGADFCWEIPFTAEVAATSPDAFVADILVANLRPAAIVTGYDFRFGASRRGNNDLLGRLGVIHNFATHVVQPVADGQGRVYSSSRARELLKAGDIVGANAVLGRPWHLEIADYNSRWNSADIVVHLDGHLKPAAGSYQVRLHQGVGQGVMAVLHVQTNVGDVLHPPARWRPHAGALLFVELLSSAGHDQTASSVRVVSQSSAAMKFASA